MNKKTYNGWTNYATWRIALEIFDGFNLCDITTSKDIYQIKEAIREHVEYVVFGISDKHGLLESFAYAFLSYVNYHEIAEHLLAELNFNLDVAEYSELKRKENEFFN